MGVNQFAEMLKYYLMLNDKTQKDLVNDLGYDKSTVSSWCSGNRVPKIDVIIDIAKYLHVNVGDLIEDNRGNEGHNINDNTLEQICDFYKDLNEDGKAEALKRIYELAQISYYAKINTLPIPNSIPLSTFVEQHREDIPADKRVASDTLLNAAHAILKSSKADQKHDDDIMDDENF